MDDQELIQRLCGTSGEPVPTVDADDMKALWDLGVEMKKKYPEGRVAFGVSILEQHCKSGADIPAISYRAHWIGMLQHLAPEIMEPLIKDKLDAVLLAIAGIPMEWTGVGIPRDGLPFNFEDFMRRVREVPKKG
jgi:hypothetical protein